MNFWSPSKRLVLMTRRHGERAAGVAVLPVIRARGAALEAELFGDPPEATGFSATAVLVPALATCVP